MFRVRLLDEIRRGRGEAPGGIAGAETSRKEKDMQFFVYGSPTERQQPRDPAELGKFMEESDQKGNPYHRRGAQSQGDQDPS